MLYTDTVTQFLSLNVAGRAMKEEIHKSSKIMATYKVKIFESIYKIIWCVLYEKKWLRIKD